MTSYAFFDSFLYRIPFFSSDKYKNLELIYKTDEFREAIYLASLHLYETTYNKNEYFHNLSKRKRNSLLKYLIRMSTRCTPFGNFSGTGMGKVQESTSIKSFSFSSVTSLDTEFFSLLDSHILSTSVASLYTPNPCCYRINGTMRYIEKAVVDLKDQFILTELNNTTLLTKLFSYCEHGATKKQLIEFLLKHTYEPQDASHFIENLISNQILISEFSPGPTKDNHKTLETLKEKYIDSLPKNLKKYINEIHSGISKSNRQKVGLKIPYLNKLESDFRKFNNIKSVKSNSITKTNLYIQSDFASISSNILHLVKEGLDILSMLNESSNAKIHHFKKIFSERYEREEVALTEVLDPIDGIGFENFDSASVSRHDLTRGIIARAKNQHDTDKLNKISSVKSFLLTQYIEHIKSGATKIDLRNFDFSNFQSDWSNLPLTFATGIEIIRAGNKGEPLIYIKFAGGFSANAIMGRFTKDNHNIYEFASEIKSFELKNAPPDSVFAEVVYLPEDSNHSKVLMRKPVYDFEIPILGSSSKNKDFQIGINDLFLSLDEKNQLILRSKRLNKQVIPRNSTADSYHNSSNPFYFFLSLMQGGDSMRPGISYEWDHILSETGHLPRICLGQNIILSPAKWKLDQKLFEKPNDFYQEFMQIKNKLNIDNKFYIVSNFDNKLQIDLTMPECLHILESEIKKGDILIEEYLDYTLDPLIETSEGIHNNEIILFLHRNLNEN